MARKIGVIKIEDSSTRRLVDRIRRERGLPTLAGAARVLIHERCGQLKRSAERRGASIGGNPKTNGVVGVDSASGPLTTSPKVSVVHV